MHDREATVNTKFKMLVLDLDGTVLNDQKEIPERNKKAIQNLAETGIQIVVCSGRIFSGARAYATELGLTGSLVACNGALIKTIKDNRLIYTDSLNIQDVINSAKICKSKDVYVHAYIDEVLVTEQLKYTSLIYSERNKILDEKSKLDIKVVENLVDYMMKCAKRIDKLVVISEHSNQLSELRKQISSIESVEIASSSFDNIEVMNKGVSKGKAIKFLCGEMGINVNEVMAIGDNENDLDMLKTVGFPIAMGNAIDEVKMIANYITDNNENAGVAKAIEKFF
jgi:hypothetical protein